MKNKLKLSGLVLTVVFCGTIVCFAQNDNISLQGKSVMYRMGGKVFYGRPIKTLAMEKQDISIADSSATMKVKKADAFGHVSGKNLTPISDTDLAMVEVREEDMKVRKEDVFREVDQKRLRPINENMTIVETQEDARMHVRTSDAFGNVIYENLNPLTQQKVILLDEKDAVMRITTTDAFGNFSFENLNPDKAYKIKFQLEDNPLPSEDMIYIANNEGEVFQTFEIGTNKDFVFSTLSADSTKMKLMEAVEVKME